MTNKTEESDKTKKTELKIVTITCGSYCVKNPEKCKRCGLSKLNKV